MRATRSWRDEKGNNWRSLGNSCWFTNLEHDHRNRPLDLAQRFDPRYYPKYDNYDAIEVSKVMDIPRDYDGVMGVPITFLYKYCPKEFRIIDLNPHFFSLISQDLPKPKQLTLHSVNKKDPYARVLIKKISE